MAYIPPAVHQRANRPVFVRPSGAGAAAGNIRIVDMPRNGRLFIDGVEWMGGGHWDDDEPNVWVVPNAPPGRVLRVEDQYGNARGREWTTAIRWATLDSGELDWDSLTPIEDADVGTLRILNGPVGGGTVWIDPAAWKRHAPAIIARAGGLLKDDAGKPALTLAPDAFAAKDSEMIACEVECRRDGVDGFFVHLDIPGLELVTTPSR